MRADVIVVGSGAAGTFAAYAMPDLDVLILDVGKRSETSTRQGNLYGLVDSEGDLFDECIGGQLEGLNNALHSYVTPRLVGPRMRFITRDAESLSPVERRGFDPVMSFARGGLANAWGAGAYRFGDDDLRGFPITAADLSPYYDVVTRAIGISGCDDDLGRFFGSTSDLLTPMSMPQIGYALLKRYSKRRRILNRSGFFLGRPRLAVITEEFNGRSPYDYGGLEFYFPGNESVYSPSFTLDEMTRKGNVRYRPGALVLHYEEMEAGVRVTFRDLSSNETQSADCRVLVLAAGALNTSKMVLQSNQDYSAKLPLLDNPFSLLPLLDLRFVGSGQPQELLPFAMLNGVYTGNVFPEPIQLSIYSMQGCLRSEFLLDVPLSIRGCLSASRYLIPAILIAQIFYPDRPKAENYIQLSESGALRLCYEARSVGKVESSIARFFRKLGCVCSARMARSGCPGHGIHYGGALPMSVEPGRYETNEYGLLSGTTRVYIADSAAFPQLPAKNHTLTIMANAMRIGAHVKKRV